MKRLTRTRDSNVYTGDVPGSEYVIQESTHHAMETDISSPPNSKEQKAMIDMSVIRFFRWLHVIVEPRDQAILFAT